MAKKKKRSGFFKRTVELANNQFRGIFVEIIENAKSNSDVDMKILEPDLKEIIKEVSSELKKDKENAKASMDEVKGIVSNAFAALKDAIKNDRGNGLDDDTKDSWLKELDGFNISDFIDDMEIEGFEDIENEDDFATESLKEVKVSVVPKDKVSLCIRVIAIIIASIKCDEFKLFIKEEREKIDELIRFKLTNENSDSPVVVNETEEKLNNYLKDSFGIVETYYSAEDEDIEEDEEDKLSMEEFDALDNIELEKVSITSDIDDCLLTDDKIAEFKEIVKTGDIAFSKLKNFENVISESEDNTICVDLITQALLEIYLLFKKSEYNTNDTDDDFYTFMAKCITDPFVSIPCKLSLFDKENGVLDYKKRLDFVIAVYLIPSLFKK